MPMMKISASFPHGMDAPAYLHWFHGYEVLVTSFSYLLHMSGQSSPHRLIFPLTVYEDGVFIIAELASGTGRAEIKSQTKVLFWV